MLPTPQDFYFQVICKLNIQQLSGFTNAIAFFDRRDESIRRDESRLYTVGIIPSFLGWQLHKCKAILA
ncbi:hypothetical protein [Nostoc sp.]|uniref:hypothetical protein n=1 Tax=Nostoc sp. TaxID=1180 RepID=UPI002FFC617F